ncbi:uncharacterized protein LOC122990974 [Thunnus albacares]|uniref:uncharacterized protein LOC122990974 n=1 Tax=Thunnus albacares TaxID=8236 RepID=UPI001CF6CADA|nr:uncharacterized protein LOC122990974 [Thunnus albacares]
MSTCTSCHHNVTIHRSSAVHHFCSPGPSPYHNGSTSHTNTLSTGLRPCSSNITVRINSDMITSSLPRATLFSDVISIVSKSNQCSPVPCCGSHQHDQVLRGIVETLRGLTANVAQIESQLNPAPTHHSPSASGPPAPTPPSDMPAYVPREPHVPAPERYDGDLGTCRSFLLQCSLAFEQQPQTYSTDKSKVAYVVGLLTGRAKAWGAAVWDSSLSITSSYDNFVAEMKKVFDHPVRGRDTSKRLLSLHQGSHSVAEFSVEFRTLATESGWNDEALQGFFLSGLSDTVKDELAARDESTSLDELIPLAIRLDNRLRFVFFSPYPSTSHESESWACACFPCSALTSSPAPSGRGTYAARSCPLVQVFPLFLRKIRPFALVLIIVDSIKSPSRTSTLCPLSVPLLSPFREPPSFRNWTSEMPITLSGLKKEMNGKLPLTLPLATLNISSCTSVSPIPPLSSRHWSMMSFGTFSIVLCLFTWMTFSSSPGTWRNTPSMSDSAPGPLPACLPACLLWGPLPPTPSCLPLPFSLTPLSPPVLGLSLLHPHSIHLNSPPTSLAIKPYFV